jgi:hypothetical protein
VIRRHPNYAGMSATFALPRRRLIVTLTLVALACLGVVLSSSSSSSSSAAASASVAASEHHPTGAFAPFADCPFSNLTEFCILAQGKSGEFVIGRRTVPIDNTLTLQGGIFGGLGESTVFVGAEDGDTMSRVELSVPGGLAGILAPEDLPASLRRQFDESVGVGVTGVTMTPELALAASAIKPNFDNLYFEKGIALQLPLKIKLSNPFLGSDCYLGSATDPIVVNFTVAATDPPAPSKSISGVRGSFNSPPETRAVTIDHELSLVDNTFAVPRATGCGGSLSAVVDPAIDAELGLPSPAGRNTAIFDGTIELGNAEDAQNSE